MLTICFRTFNTLSWTENLREREKGKEVGKRERKIHSPKMKVRVSLKKMCKDCQFVRRKGVLRVVCKRYNNDCLSLFG